MTQVDLEQKSFFERVDPNKLVARLSEYLSASHIKSTAGLIAPIDAALSSQIQFSPEEMSRRAVQLLHRLADVYLQDVDRDLSILAAMRERFDNLNYQITTDVIAQYEFDENEKVHQEEVAAGWYTVQKDVSALELASQTAWSAAATEASEIYTNTLKTNSVRWNEQDPDKFAGYKAHATILSLFSPYNIIHKQEAPSNDYLLNFTYTNFDTAEGPFDAMPKIFPADPDHLQRTSVPQALWSVVKTASLPETVYSVATVNSQVRLGQGAAVSAQALTESKKLLADWNSADRRFRELRTQIAIDLNSMRRKARSTVRGPFDLDQQLSSTRSDFVDRCADVYVRCQTMRIGFSAVWGLTIPAEVPDVHAWDDGGSFFDAIVGWVRYLKREFSSVLALEASTVWPISVSSIVGLDVWLQTLANASAAGSQSITFQFEIPSTFLSNLKMARMRGVAAYAKGVDDTAAGPWRASLKPPPIALQVTHASVLYQDTPTVDLARISTRESAKPPDVVGMSSLRNILPIATKADTSTITRVWTLVIDRHSLRGADAISLKDIELDFFVAGEVC